MADNARGIHVSPGIYAKETDITYAVKSLGITTLGVVGETLKGPAFEPVLVNNWREFKSLFGGTSTEKFSESQYPKYELPYIAKSYLTESSQLEVCRVLGLSGYNAGPAWVVTAPYGDKNVPVAVLRSRGHYEQYHKIGADFNDNECECPSEVYDKLFYEVGEKNSSAAECAAPTSYNMDAVVLAPYMQYDSNGNECSSYKPSSEQLGFTVSIMNHGKFKICGVKGASEAQQISSKEYESEAAFNEALPSLEANDNVYYKVTVEGVVKYYQCVAADEDNKAVIFTSKDLVISGNALINKKKAGMNYFEYPVSLNPGEKDYILKVLGTNPNDGDAPLFVESLYDVMLSQLISENKVTSINQILEKYPVYHVSDYSAIESVVSIVSKEERGLRRSDVGLRYLADAESSNVNYHEYSYADDKWVDVNTAHKMKPGHIYTVAQYTDENGKRHYFYRHFNDEFPIAESNTEKLLNIQLKDELSNAEALSTLVYNKYDNLYYRLTPDNTDVAPVTCDMNNYRDAYRFASTPWIVSNVKGDADKIELNKLFRFHTISDGNTANKEVKVSIQNIKTDEGTFEVVVRDINDTDEQPVYLERFTKCSLTPGEPNYIAYKIGSYDGVYESKSNFITVEVNETTAVRNSVPAGFLGYPLSGFDGFAIKDEDVHTNMTRPVIAYNTNFDSDIKNRKQYFGLSNRVGVDVDMFTYKGRMAYGEAPSYLSQGFHLDSRVGGDGKVDNCKLTVDGESGYEFDAVSTQNRTKVLNGAPIIGTEAEMYGSIYEYVDLRKFTVYFYGGFDGWDEYRKYRSNTDDFKMSKYRGVYNDANGEGLAFNAISNTDELELNQSGITSDWYAYLAGIRKFANPENVDINVFATPGIDIINNKSLVEEAIEMIEEERADSIYVATMPDKPFGASDFTDEMYSPDDVVYGLEDTGIDSNYTCTYYPWVKYEDTDNNQYVYLPPTKDVVRNMALTDNTSYSWFAPAGISRGDVNCVRAHYVTKMGDEDVLYEGRINPVKTFASDGVKIWGQKNLQVRESQLNRIAVRRLLLRMRKLISIACIGLIFEPNDPTTKNKFLSTVMPIMDNIKSNRGISDYKIEVNDTVESRERRELPAKIFFKPYNALEYIVLDFVVTPEAVSFDNI